MEGTTTEKRSSAARQVAMWLKRATVGSFVVMRHEYERCRFCPKWLKNESGEYNILVHKVCQPTVNQICHAYDKVYQGGASALGVRRDLWQNANTFVLPDDQSQSLQKSCLITRTRLACLTGGKVNKHQYGNPLNVGTPVTYCGGAAIATKNGKVHHICIKEEMNCPYPSTYTEQFVVYRKAPSPEKSGRQQKDVQLLIQAHPNHPPIPIFWEPTDQIGSAVMYIGHWTIAQIEDLKDRAEKYLGYYRCAKLYFDFHHFDERWEKVFRLCHDKPHEQIKELDFRGIET
eukprot:scaffold5759_cov93-Skeletonema_marinoi.AAC.1